MEDKNLRGTSSTLHAVRYFENLIPGLKVIQTDATFVDEKGKKWKGLQFFIAVDEKGVKND